MITLKKSFELKNYYNDLLGEAREILLSSDVLNKTQEHLFNKVVPDMENEIRIVPKETDVGCTVEELVDFVLNLLEQIECLTSEISHAKRYATIDMDGTVSINKYKRDLIQILSIMCGRKPKEIKSQGTAQKFNEQGDPVIFSYDIVEHVELDFDREDLRQKISKLRKEADENSNDIDRVQLDTMVFYEPFCDVGDPLDVSIQKMKLFRSSIENLND